MAAVSQPTGKRPRQRAYVTGVERWVMECLRYMPMASAQDLAYAFGKEPSVVYRGLASLEEQGLVSSLLMSCSRRRQRRWWLRAPEEQREGFVSYSHSSNAVARLLDNPVATEWFYFLASSLPITDYGKSIRRSMLEFSWFRDRAFDAAARFTDGWVAFLWSGYWQDERTLDERFQRLVEGSGHGWGGRLRPSLYCFVVPDWWQGCLVLDTARRYGIVDSLYVGVVDNGWEVGALELNGGSRDWLMGDYEDEPGFTPLDGPFSGSLIREPDGAWLIRLMFCVEQWPGVTKKSLSCFTRQSYGRVKRGLDRLLSRGMVMDLGGRFAVQGAWLANAARRDRVWSGRPGRHFAHEMVSSLYDGRIQRHEQGLMRVMRCFAEAGCSVASGWRAYDVMGKDGQVAPDGVVWLDDSPFGGGWHYMEYELRAKGERLVDAKLRGYYSRVRSNDYPVMVVCSREAERTFAERGAGLKMLLTTVPEAKGGPLVSDGTMETVWRLHGEPVRLLG